jgi:hypothetical protein
MLSPVLAALDGRRHAVLLKRREMEVRIVALPEGPLAKVLASFTDGQCGAHHAHPALFSGLTTATPRSGTSILGEGPPCGGAPGRERAADSGGLVTTVGVR